MENLALEKEIEKAAGDLPEGWEIRLCVEKDSAWVDLVDPDGIKVEIDTADLSLAEQIDESVTQALLCMAAFPGVD